MSKENVPAAVYNKQTVNPQQLADLILEEGRRLNAQAEMAARRVMKEFDFVPMACIYRQRNSNATIRTPEENAQFYVDRLRAAIEDLVKKGWITEDGKPCD